MIVAVTFGITISLGLLSAALYYAVQVFGASARSSASEPSGDFGTIARSRRLSSLPWLDSFLARLPGTAGLERLRERAACLLPLEQLVGLCVAPACLSVTLFATGVIGPGAAFMIAMGTLAPPFYLSRRAAGRLAHFQQQLPEALDTMARSLRAGHSFLASMKMIADECPPPIKTEFAAVIEEIAFGVSVTNALKRFTARIDSPALRFLVTSIMIQRESGGNLAEIIDAISSMTRKHFELEAKVLAVSAEGRLSAVILFALPFLLALLMGVLNPDYILVLFRDPLGQAMVAGAGALMLLGAVVTKRMITIRA